MDSDQEFLLGWAKQGALNQADEPLSLMAPEVIIHDPSVVRVVRLDIHIQVLPDFQGVFALVGIKGILRDWRLNLHCATSVAWNQHETKLHLATY